MRRHSSILLLLFLVGCTWLDLDAQHAPPLDLSAYREYFEKHSDLTAAGLLAEYPTGTFAETAPTDLLASSFGPEIHTLFELTPDEVDLVQKHGFVVSERMSYPSFGRALLDIFVNDMPVYVSSDAILHALHMSYDDILQDIERSSLIPNLRALLADLHDELPALAAENSTLPDMDPSLRDLDVYLTVPRRLLGENAAPFFADNETVVAELLDFVEAEEPANVPLFAETPRNVDFSQFKPRGHYTDEPDLRQYFQAMIWLGRTELYLIAPQSTLGGPSEADVQRQIVMTALLSELVARSGSGPILDEMDLVLRTMVGGADNVTLDNVRSVFEEVGIDEAVQLLDTAAVRVFQDRLKEKPFAFQRILSQILFRDPGSSEPIEPASAFLLLGQRFIIDSYVTANVVYDRIPAKRMMPSTLDILFAVGNDGAAQFLEDDLERYGYAPHLASLRYLIDSYDASFWTSSMYNGWLNSIRKLSPPAGSERDVLPAFMQTAGWWQKQMNTQLASWAQLRHDNLLYAKQSYTAGVVCMFPESYVEPIPEFFEAVRAFMERAGDQLGAVLPGRTENEQLLKDRIVGYFGSASSTMDTLVTISRKQLEGIPFSDEERLFLGDMLMEMQEYAFRYVDGWYPKLYYNDYNQYDEGGYFTGRIFQEDLVVADVHTQPTDEVGNPVGKVLHAGTGPVNLAVIVAEVPGGGRSAFVGPVMSYYEHVTLNFERLNDDEWAAMYDESPPFRPEFANPYLADREGRAVPGGLSLSTGVETDPSDPSIPNEIAVVQNYPNPFKASTVIGFSVPRDESGASHVTLTVYNALGQQVARLVDELLTPGHYTVRWTGDLAGGRDAPSGSYSYVVEVGGRQSTGLMTKVR